MTASIFDHNKRNKIFLGVAFLNLYVQYGVWCGDNH